MPISCGSFLMDPNQIPQKPFCLNLKNYDCTNSSCIIAVVDLLFAICVGRTVSMMLLFVRFKAAGWNLSVAQNTILSTK